MKNTGITRKIDDMGRIVLPMELRRNLNIDDGAAHRTFCERRICGLGLLGERGT